MYNHILVTGASGFVGQHTVTRLLERGYRVTAIARDKEKAGRLPWSNKVRFLCWDIHNDQFFGKLNPNQYDALIHLSWDGLPNYKSLLHYETRLLKDYVFLKKIIQAGIEQIVVTGTCFEYGLQEGSLHEALDTRPNIPYAIAKDSLRKFLQELQRKYPFRLKWARLFYVYGQGQNSSSLLPLLDDAIDRGDRIFNMSGGEQLRDYLSVEDVAKNIVSLYEHPNFDGIVNICSGKPISVRRLVEEHIARRKAAIQLNLGYYPYPDYEPMAFWGDVTKLQKLLGQSHRHTTPISL